MKPIACEAVGKPMTPAITSLVPLPGTQLRRDQNRLGKTDVPRDGDLRPRIRDATEDARGSEKPAIVRALDTPHPYIVCASLYVMYCVAVFAFGTTNSIACAGPAMSTMSAGFGCVTFAQPS